MKTQISPKTESKSDSLFPRAPIPLSAIRDFRAGCAQVVQRSGWPNGFRPSHQLHPLALFSRHNQEGLGR